MIRSHCAPASARCARAVGLYALAALYAPAAPSQPVPAPVQGELVKSFDFDERPLGNFEDTPMYWRRLTGDGLPSYSNGRLDDDVGHTAAPSFVLQVRGGNVAYEYGQDDVRVLPGVDYVVSGFVRAAGLEWASALLVCYLVDDAGKRIAGSERVSELVRSASGQADGEPWQRLEVPLAVDFAEASAIRIQLWVLQNYVFEQPPKTELDPIVRQEVDARVWFDDLAVVRVPRARLRLSNPGGLVQPGAQESFEIDLQNAIPVPMKVDLRVWDESGVERLHENFELAARAVEHYTRPLPPLGPGLYRADLHLSDADEVRARRTIQFAVLPPLPGTASAWERLGVSLGRWPGGTVEGPIELVQTLRCGALNVDVPISTTTVHGAQDGSWHGPLELAERLALDGTELCGVIYEPPPPDDAGRVAGTPPDSPAHVAWADEIGPTLAYFGGVITTWQLGHPPNTASSAGRWDKSTLEALQRRLERFVAAPRLVVPRSILDAPPATTVLELGLADDPAPSAPAPEVRRGAAAPWVESYWVPADLPTRTLPWHLAFWLEASSVRGDHPGSPVDVSRWLALGPPHGDGVASAERIADFARRVALAAAVDPERLIVPAPFELRTTGDGECWQPTEEYIPLRTLATYLAGSRAAASMQLEHEALGLLFVSPARNTLIVWTWRSSGDDAAAELVVGRDAVALDLWGTTQPLTLDGPRASVPLKPIPLIVANVNAPLMLLPRTFSIEPASIQVHDPESRPVLSLRNTFPVELSGTIELAAPATWQVAPLSIRLQLAPQETLEQPLELSIPPREAATGQVLGVDIRIRQPESVDLHFDVPIRVGLRDVQVAADAWWSDDDLVVEQSLTNLSPRPVNFDAFCQPPSSPQVQGVFLDVPPGATRTCTYRIPGARQLAGAQLWLGVREIGGRRTLDQLVSVPR